MAEYVARVTTLFLLVAIGASGGGVPFYFYSGSPAPVVPQFYIYGTQMVAGPVLPEAARSGETLPCPAEGFYPHPSNCSRFYRCVDYAGTGQYFSRYEFQCPPGQMFLAVGKDTCVPGDCPGGAPAPGPAPGSAPGPAYPGPVGDDPGSYPPSPPDPIDTGAISGGGAYPQPGHSTPMESPSSGSAASETGPGAGYPATEPVTNAPPSPTTPAYPQPGGDQSTSQSGAESPTSPGAGYPQPGVGTAGDCPASYVQDPTYCNIYLRCPDDNNRYVCTAGTVFDQGRQMCRLDDQEDVCGGKPMYTQQAGFRSEFPVLTEGGSLQSGNRQTFQAFSQGQTFPSFSQGQTFPSFSQGQSFPSFSQGQTFPSFSQGQAFPSFSQGQTFPSFSQGQTFPSFNQGQTFPSFNQGQSFPSSQPLVYTAQVPTYNQVGGSPQFDVSGVEGGQGTTFYQQPSYVVPNYLAHGK